MVSLPKTLYAFIWHFLKRYKLSIIILLILGAVWAIEVTVAPYMLKIMVDKVSENPNHPDLLQLLSFPAFCYLGMFIISNVTLRLWDYVMLKIFPLIKAKVIMKVTRYLELHSHEFFQNNFSGSLVNKISDLNNGVETILRLIINNFIPNILALIIASFAIISTHPFFIIAISIWAVTFFSISIKVSGYSESLFETLSESRSKLMGKITDSITNITSVRLFSRHLHEINKIKNQLKDTVLKDRKAQWCLLFIHAFQGASIVALTSVTIYLLIYLRQENLITVGDFVLIMSLSFSIADIIKSLSDDYVTLSIYVGICKQALSITNQPHAITDKSDAYKLVIKEGKIEFKNVTFRYRKNCNVFKNQSLTIPAKQKIGLVGYSGSGKTTFVNLIIRLFEISEGQILIDENDIVAATQNSLRESISFIPQDPTLFHGSIMENIRYGKLNATDEEVIEASKKAHAHEFIIKTAEGYNFLVGERGMKLSGGQRQRIAIARAILKNAPILILDEATSALDSITENLIQDSLKELMQNKTVLVIAHRLSTLLTMDRILVFDQGHIVEEGIHSELLEKKGLYWTLWNSQVGGFIPTSS